MKDTPRKNERDLSRLGNPVFLLSVALLILNDHFFKEAFHNDITGKISDFAGLIAFPFLFSTLFPRQKFLIHLLTGLMFIWWKSALSQPFIDLVNTYGMITNRTVDFTDNIALISIFFSWTLSKYNYTIVDKRIALNIILVISSVAFIATSRPPQKHLKYTFNMQYNFKLPKKELISRLNGLQARSAYRVTKATNGRIVFDRTQNTFKGDYVRGDTLATLLDNSALKDTDTLRVKNSGEEYLIFGNDMTSSIKLLSITYRVGAFKKGDYRKKALRRFEKKVIKKLHTLNEKIEMTVEPAL